MALKIGVLIEGGGGIRIHQLRPPIYSNRYAKPQPQAVPNPTQIKTERQTINFFFSQSFNNRKENSNYHSSHQ